MGISSKRQQINRARAVRHMDKIDQMSIKRSNLLRFWEAFEGKSTVTRQELADRTGLSLMSITCLVNQLVDRKALTVSAPLAGLDARRPAGRRAETISVNKYDLVWLWIDLTSRRFMLYALTMDRQPLYTSQPWAYDETRSYEENIDLFLRRGRKYVDNELKGHEIMGIGVVVPGPYDLLEDRARSERVPEISEIRLKETLRYELGLYEYYVDEDAKFTVRAFFPLAQKSGGELLYYLCIGEGVSGAISHAGNVLRGQNALAGDVGALLSPQGAPCGASLSSRAFANALLIPNADGLDEEALLAAIRAAAQNDPALYEKALEPFADGAAALLLTVARVLDPLQIVLDCHYAQFSARYFPRVAQTLSAALGERFVAKPQLIPAPSDRLSVITGIFQVLSREWLYRIA